MADRTRTPSPVEPALEALAVHAARRTLLSSVSVSESVNRANTEPNADEGDQLVEPAARESDPRVHPPSASSPLSSCN